MANDTADGGDARPGLSAPAVDELSPLARMMIESASVAVREGEYVDALEHLLTIASIEVHPQITVALASTILDVIGALELDGRARDVRLALLRSDEIAGPLGDVLGREAIFRLLGRVRALEAGSPSPDGTSEASELIEAITGVLPARRIALIPSAAPVPRAFPPTRLISLADLAAIAACAVLVPSLSLIMIYSAMNSAAATRTSAEARETPLVLTNTGNATVFVLPASHDQVEVRYRRKLADLEKKQGPDHPNVGIWLNRLAGVHLALGNYAEAQPLYERSRAILKKALRPDHPNLGIVLHNLAELHKAQGRYAEAELLYRKALVILEKTYGSEHPSVAMSLQNLADLWRAQARYVEAEPLYRRALAIMEKTLGPDHPNVVTTLNGLAQLRTATNRQGEAQALYRRALAIREKGPKLWDAATGRLVRTFKEHADAGDARAMNNIGSLYANGLGVPQDYAKAREWYEKAADVGFAPAMTTLGWIYANGRGVPQDYAKAREWYEKAADAGEAPAITALGSLYASGRGVPQDYAKAREWFEKAADAGDARAMTRLGGLSATGRGVPKDYAKAREWYEKAAAEGDSVVALGNLSWYALLAREFAQALDAAERAHKANPDLLWIERNRAHALMFLNKPQEARDAYLAHKDKQMRQDANGTWQEAIAEGFAQLREANLDHPQMVEIEVALGIVGWRRTPVGEDR